MITASEVSKKPGAVHVIVTTHSQRGDHRSQFRRPLVGALACLQQLPTRWSDAVQQWSC